jgi:hypothetical protein
MYRDGEGTKRIKDRGIWKDVRSVERYIHHRATELKSRGVKRILK